MKYKDIAAGENFMFGRMDIAEWRNGGYWRGEKPLIWTKLYDDTGIAILNPLLENGNDYTSFDRGRPDGQNKMERTHGLCVYSMSKIKDELVNSYLDTCMNGSEQDFLRPFTVTIPVSQGYTRRFGATDTWTEYISLPTKADAERFSELADRSGMRYSIEIPTCEAEHGKQIVAILQRVGTSIWFRTDMVDKRHKMCPVIKIDDETELTEVNTRWGTYFMARADAVSMCSFEEILRMAV